MGKSKEDNKDNNDAEVLKLQNTILELTSELDDLKLKQKDLEKIKEDFDELTKKYDNVTKLNSELLVKNTELSKNKSKDVEDNEPQKEETMGDFIKEHFNNNEKGEN